MSLQRCPTEIWRTILQFSVEFPGSLETKWDHSPDDFLWDGFEQQQPYTYKERSVKDPIYYSALKTKLSIAQVSRTWREIGVELLYEHLFFCDDDGEENEDEEEVFRSMEKVAAIFECHTNESGYGGATKRIDVAIAATYPLYLPTLIRLLSFCHNLRVFTVFNSAVYRGPECTTASLIQLASLLQTRFRHSLRRVSFHLGEHDMAKGSRPLRYHIHLPDLPLTSLEIGNHSPLPYTPPPPAITTLSALIILIARSSLRNFVSWHCPALRHLTLFGVNNDCVQSNISFLISHGPQLISLAIHSYIRGTPVLSPLIAPAINLRCLVYDYRSAATFSDQDIFPSITHIGIHLKPGEAHLSRPPFTASIFPKLQCLRFLTKSSERPEWLLDIARELPHTRVEIRTTN